MSETTFGRPEYAALADSFVHLARGFGHDVTPALQRDIARLASTIECVDRTIDEIDDADARRAMWRRVLAILDGETGDTEIDRSVVDLRTLADARGARARVRRVVAKEARLSEVLRTTPSAGEYVRATVIEGQMTTALALIVAGDACGREFRRFFFRLSGPANLVDKILDARRDHAKGEIAIVPGLLFHLRLAGELLARTIALFAHPLLTMRLGYRFLVAEPLRVARAS